MNEAESNRVKPLQKGEQSLVNPDLVTLGVSNSTTSSRASQDGLNERHFSPSLDEFLERETPIIAAGQLDLFGL